MRQTFRELVIHTPHGRGRYRLPWSFSTFDYRELCGLLDDQNDAEFEIAKVDGRTGDTVHTDRGDLSRAADRRRARLAAGARRGPATSRPTRRSRAAWRCTRTAPATSSRSGSTAATCPPATAGASPRGTRCASASARSTRASTSRTPTVALAEDLEREAVRYQGNWIPHRLRDAVEDGVFFVGDSAGHCLPLTAEGIRTAFYFGIACGRELRAVVEGRATVAEALTRYGAFSASHRWKFESMLRVQRLIPRVPPRLLGPAIRAMSSQRFVDWSFTHYLRIAPPEFAGPGPASAGGRACGRRGVAASRPRPRSAARPD